MDSGEDVEDGDRPVEIEARRRALLDGAEQHHARYGRCGCETPRCEWMLAQICPPLHVFQSVVFRRVVAVPTKVRVVFNRVRTVIAFFVDRTEVDMVEGGMDGELGSSTFLAVVFADTCGLEQLDIVGVLPHTHT